MKKLLFLSIVAIPVVAMQKPNVPKEDLEFPEYAHGRGYYGGSAANYLPVVRAPALLIEDTSIDPSQEQSIPFGLYLAAKMAAQPRFTRKEANTYYGVLPNTEEIMVKETSSGAEGTIKKVSGQVENLDTTSARDWLNQLKEQHEHRSK